MFEQLDLPVVYWSLLALSVFVYAVLDGYDLGVGMLLPMNDRKRRDRMVASIGPFWDANETWLVLIIGLLFIAFPSAHSVVMAHLYFPVFVMLVGLIMRGMAFDFRVKAKQDKQQAWDWIFKIGSAIAAMSQGYMIGRYVLGFDESWFAYAFAMVAAYGVMTAYCFIGGTWLVYKTEGKLQKNAIKWSRNSARAVFFGIVMISLLSPMVYSEAFAAQVGQKAFFVSVMIPCACLLLFMHCEHQLSQVKLGVESVSHKPLIDAALVFLTCIIGLGVMIFPYIIPGQMLLHEVASAPESLAFLLAGALFVIPMILLYTGLSYWIFRGKSQELSYE
jgi:cytochrome d ubiquinol oxidase subunit II